MSLPGAGGSRWQNLSAEIADLFAESSGYERYDEALDRRAAILREREREYRRDYQPRWRRRNRAKLDEYNRREREKRAAARALRTPPPPQRQQPRRMLPFSAPPIWMAGWLQTATHRGYWHFFPRGQAASICRRGFRGDAVKPHPNQRLCERCKFLSDGEGVE